MRFSEFLFRAICFVGWCYLSAHYLMIMKAWSDGGHIWDYPNLYAAIETWFLLSLLMVQWFFISLLEEKEKEK